MTENIALQIIGHSIGIAGAFGFVFGLLYFWVDKNIK